LTNAQVLLFGVSLGLFVWLLTSMPSLPWPWYLGGTVASAVFFGFSLLMFLIMLVVRASWIRQARDVTTNARDIWVFNTTARDCEAWGDFVEQEWGVHGRNTYVPTLFNWFAAIFSLSVSAAIILGVISIRASILGYANDAANEAILLFGVAGVCLLVYMSCFTLARYSKYRLALLAPRCASFASGRVYFMCQVLNFRLRGAVDATVLIFKVTEMANSVKYLHMKIRRGRNTFEMRIPVPEAVTSESIEHLRTILMPRNSLRVL
jgi:hypothetical protein